MQLNILVPLFLNAVVSSLNDSECNPDNYCDDDIDCCTYSSLQPVTLWSRSSATKCDTYMNTCSCDVDGYNRNTCLPDVYGCTMCTNEPSSLSELDYSSPRNPGYIAYSDTYYCMNDMYPYSSFTTEIRGIGIHEPPYNESTTVNLRLCSGSTDLTKPIILLLSSYYATQWTISSNDTYVINNIQIDSIVALSYYHQSTSVFVQSNIAINNDDIHIMDPYSSPWNGSYGYGDDKGGGHTAKMIYQTPIILGDYLYSFIGTDETNNIDACVGNQAINVSNNITINTRSLEITNINCNDCNVICSNLKVDINKDMSLYLRCNAFEGDECENIIINGNYADEINITCIGCSHVYIHGEFVRNINIFCYVCDDMYIDAEYAQTIEIYCDEGYMSGYMDYGCYDMYIDAEYAQNIYIYCDGCNDMIILATFIEEYIQFESIASKNISIYGEEAAEINIDAQGWAAFTNSSIYAQNATTLIVSCYSSFYTTNPEAFPACFNTNIYVSSNIKSNSLICKYGCNGINLFFEEDIDVKLFEKIIFDECNGCPEFNVCGDIWRIYYNEYNESIIYDRSIDVMEEGEDDALWSLYNYVRENYACTAYEHILFNESFAMYNIIICSIFGILFMMLLVIVIKDLMKKIKNYYKKMKYPMLHFISNKPSLCVLQYSILSDVVICLAIIWWLIKLTILWYRIPTYCAAKYSDISDDAFEDVFCDGAINYIMIAFWCFPIVWTVLTIILAIILRSYYNVNVCDFFVCLCNRYEHYNERTLWMSGPVVCGCKSGENLYGLLMHLVDVFRIILVSWFCDYGVCCELDGPNVFQYLGIHFIRHGIYFLLTWTMVRNYGDCKSDFVIRWYEFYPILIVFVIKIVLQMCYTFAPKYDQSDEYFRGLSIIHELLKGVFGFDIGNIIFSYLSTRDEQSIELTTNTQAI